MWLSDLSIRQPVFVAMIMAALTVLGLVSYTRMGVDLYPDVSFPVIAVTTTYPGGTPEEVESQVTEPLEDALRSISGMESMRSTSSESVSLLVLEFKVGYPLDRATADVRDRVAATVAALPRDAGQPAIQRFDPGAQPIFTVAVSPGDQPLSAVELRSLARDGIKPRLERIDGVAAVTVLGGLEREVKVDLNLDALKARNLTPQQVTAALRSQNLNVPGGRITDAAQDWLLRTTGEFEKAEDIGRVLVSTSRSGIPIYLRDVASVSEGAKEVTTIPRLNGRDAVVLTVTKQSGSNTVQVSRRVRDQLQVLQAEAGGLRFSPVRDEAIFIEDSLGEVVRALFLGAIAASLVVWLFFGDLRNTLVTVAGLPVIVIATFGAMALLGFTLNLLTMMALSLSIGILVDDAIVVRENIIRHMEAGSPPAVAASRGTAEIAFPVLAMSLTLVAVFIPVAFATGVIGMFFRQFGLTVAVAVLISLFEAFTLAPMLSARFFRSGAQPPSPAGLLAHDPLPSPSRERGEVRVGRRTIPTPWVNAAHPLIGASRFQRLFIRLTAAYGRLLAWGLHHRWIVASATAAVLVATAALVPFIGFTFTPSSDQGFFTVSLDLPPGTTLREADSTSRYIEDILLEQPEAPSVYAQVGSEAAPENISLFVRTPPHVKSGPLLDRTRTIFAGILGLQVNVGNFNSGGGSASEAVQGRPIQLGISGPLSLAEFDLLSEDVLARIKAIPGVIEADRSYKPGKPELRLEVDRERAGEFGLSPAAVGATVRGLWQGETATRFRQGGKEVDIRVRLRQEDRRNLAGLLALTLSAGGQAPSPAFSNGAQAPSPVGVAGGAIPIPLASVVKPKQVTGPTRIQRQDGERQVIIGSDYLRTRALGDVVKDVTAAVQEMQLPAGVRTRFLGQAKQAQEAFSSLLLALGLAVVFVYMVLASQFGSFVHPLTIMFALPLSFGGAFLALAAARKPLDVIAMIGMIMLMGLVTKNSILLIDLILRLRRDGSTREQAILRAGPARLRPILMTTAGMVLGMAPTAFALGAGSEFRSPMGVTVIGGLITSTLLTLVVVPIVYTFLDDLQHFRLRIRLRRQAAPPKSEAMPGPALKATAAVGLEAPAE